MQVLHEACWGEEGAFDGEGADVGFRFGFGVEGPDVGVFVGAEGCDVREGAEY